MLGMRDWGYVKGYEKPGRKTREGTRDYVLWFDERPLSRITRRGYRLFKQPILYSVGVRATILDEVIKHCQPKPSRRELR